MNASGPELVLFDLDGTLVDTYPGLLAALRDALAQHGLHTPASGALRACVSHGAQAMVASALPDADEHLRDSVKTHFLACYAADPARDCALFDGIEEVLTHLSQSNRRFGVVTNKAQRFTDPLLRSLSLDERACVIVSGDTAQRAKPHPDPLLLAMQWAQATPQTTLYIGDDERDVIAARAAGVDVVAVRYGYHHLSDDPSNWAADAVIDAPRELLRWLP